LKVKREKEVKARTFRVKINIPFLFNGKSYDNLGNTIEYVYNIELAPLVKSSGAFKKL
jgi:hypothetical protein